MHKARHHPGRKISLTTTDHTLAQVIELPGQPGTILGFFKLMLEGVVFSLSFQVIELLAEHLSQWSCSIAFPELAHLPLLHLRKFGKQ